MRNKVVLITGASSGIGKTTADYLMKKGFHIYGTSRKALGNIEVNEASDALTGGFLRMIPMDVTNEESVDNAINTVIEKEGHIDVLVCNAGAGIAGSVEDVSMEEARTQFDINFFGTLRVIKAVLPLMRDQGYGKIIAVSSVAGVISIPYQAHYSSSKYAVEGLAEALRYEVAPFGIKVCLVEPGDTKTGFTKSRITAQKANRESPYYERFTRSLARMEKDEQNGASPISVARVIYKMIKKKNPPVRTTVGLQYKTILFLKKILPGSILEKVVGLLYN
ncbi:MAG: SDR family oxidoreductase [Clostridiaceae bacterium]|jgi:short-subunit dehydrogenase|nr:SDR family oxidoreductase [Clostridiaceae bacterium]